LYGVNIPSELKNYDTLAREAKEARHARSRFVGEGLDDHNMAVRPLQATKNSAEGLRKHHLTQKQQFMLESRKSTSPHYRRYQRGNSGSGESWVSDDSFVSGASFASNTSAASIGRNWPLREKRAVGSQVAREGAGEGRGAGGGGGGGGGGGRNQREKLWLAKQVERQQVAQNGWQAELEEEEERRRAEEKQEELDLEVWSSEGILEV
jgi:hypothetical protein